jgi:hypothetical protein
MAFDPATKAALRVDYEESDLTLVAMGVKYGCSPSYISRLARVECWLMRSERLGRSPRAFAAASLQVRDAIAQRLSRVINKRLDQMEQGLENGTLSPEDAERGAKTVGSMIGGFAKVVVRQDLPNEDKQRPSAVAAPGAANEVERLQREIVERFERIQRRRDAERGSA